MNEVGEVCSVQLDRMAILFLLVYMAILHFLSDSKNSEQETQNFLLLGFFTVEVHIGNI